MNSSTDISHAAKELETNGYYVFRGFFALEEVEKARQQISTWFEADLKERSTEGISEPWHKGAAGTTILTSPTHLMLDAYAKSPVLDQLVEKILTDQFSSAVLKALVGEHIKLRGYNVQKLTGVPDPKPIIGAASNPHEWHRDSLGEIGLAIFLEDVPGPNNGATSIVPGSHYFPYCPRWNCLFGPPYVLKQGKRGLNWFLRFNFFSKLLAKRKVNKTATGAYGKQGDFYIFINDLWHGREPNTEGRTGIKMMIGAFAVDDPFPDQVVPPGESVLAKLPPRLRQAAAQHQPAIASRTDDSIIKRLRAHRSASAVPLIFKLAKMERKLADAVSRTLHRIA